MLNPRFKEPGDIQWKNFEWENPKTGKGHIPSARVNFAHVAARGTRRAQTILLTGGREPVKKYMLEPVHRYLETGHEIWAPDWIGQGGSQRYLADTDKTHNQDYDDQIDMLKTFIKDIVKPDVETPLFIVAHSMGGHIAQRFLSEYPENPVTLAVMTAPMNDIHTPIPHLAAAFVVAAAVRLGFKEKYSFGDGGWEEKDPFEDNELTSDKERFNIQQELFEKEKPLRLGGKTFGWVHETFKSIRKLNKKSYLSRIKTPIVMVIPTGDTVADIKASRQAASIIPNCEKFEIEGNENQNIPLPKHEIQFESDRYRDQCMNKIHQSLEEGIKTFTPRNPQIGPKVS